MARPRIYKDEDERRKAETARKAKFNTENNVQIKAYLKPEYAGKLNAISEKLQCSKAEVFRICLDRLYNELFPAGTDETQD